MRSVRLILLSTLTLALAGCPADRTAPGSPELITCNTTEEIRATEQIGPQGGTLQVGDHRLEVPAGAVAQTVSFTGVLLADELLKVTIQADGADEFRFQSPATLTLSYARCPAPAEPERLRIYKIDPRTNRVLEDVGGRAAPQERTITAPLDGLSTYTAGAPT
jgi:hypothetical protein